MFHRFEILCLKERQISGQKIVVQIIHDQTVKKIFDLLERNETIIPVLKIVMLTKYFVNWLSLRIKQNLEN